MFYWIQWKAIACHNVASFHFYNEMFDVLTPRKPVVVELEDTRGRR